MYYLTLVTMMTLADIIRAETDYQVTDIIPAASGDMTYMLTYGMEGWINGWMDVCVCVCVFEI